MTWQTSNGYPQTPLSHSVQGRPSFASLGGVVRPQDVHLALAGPMSPVGPQEGDMFDVDFDLMPLRRVAVRFVRDTTSCNCPRERRPCTLRGLGAILLATKTVRLPFFHFELPCRLSRAAPWGSWGAVSQSTPFLMAVLQCTPSGALWDATRALGDATGALGDTTGVLSDATGALRDAAVVRPCDLSRPFTAFAGSGGHDKPRRSPSRTMVCL